jgi:hypothetical protein
MTGDDEARGGRAGAMTAAALRRRRAAAQLLSGLREPPEAAKDLVGGTNPLKLPAAAPDLVVSLRRRVRRAKPVVREREALHTVAYLLGWRDRSFAVAAEDARRVHPGGGIVRATAVADGRVLGTWSPRCAVKRRRSSASRDELRIEGKRVRPWR